MEKDGIMSSHEVTLRRVNMTTRVARGKRRIPKTTCIKRTTIMDEEYVSTTTLAGRIWFLFCWNWTLVSGKMIPSVLTIKDLEGNCVVISIYKDSVVKHGIPWLLEFCLSGGMLVSWWNGCLPEFLVSFFSNGFEIADSTCFIPFSIGSEDYMWFCKSLAQNHGGESFSLHKISTNCCAEAITTANVSHKSTTVYVDLLVNESDMIAFCVMKSKQLETAEDIENCILTKNMKVPSGVQTDLESITTEGKHIVKRKWRTLSNHVMNQQMTIFGCKTPIDFRRGENSFGKLIESYYSLHQVRFNSVLYVSGESFPFEKPYDSKSVFFSLKIKTKSISAASISRFLIHESGDAKLQSPILILSRYGKTKPLVMSVLIDSIMYGNNLETSYRNFVTGMNERESFTFYKCNLEPLEVALLWSYPIDPLDSKYKPFSEGIMRQVIDFSDFTGTEGEFKAKDKYSGMTKAGAELYRSKVPHYKHSEPEVKITEFDRMCVNTPDVYVPCEMSQIPKERSLTDEDYPENTEEDTKRAWITEFFRTLGFRRDQVVGHEDLAECDCGEDTLHFTFSYFKTFMRLIDHCGYKIHEAAKEVSLKIFKDIVQTSKVNLINGVEFDVLNESELTDVFMKNYKFGSISFPEVIYQSAGRIEAAPYARLMGTSAMDFHHYTHGKHGMNPERHASLSWIMGLKIYFDALIRKNGVSKIGQVTRYMKQLSKTPGLLPSLDTVENPDNLITAGDENGYDFVQEISWRCYGDEYASVLFRNDFPDCQAEFPPHDPVCPEVPEAFADANSGLCLTCKQPYGTSTKTGLTCIDSWCINYCGNKATE